MENLRRDIMENLIEQTFVSKEDKLYILLEIDEDSGNELINRYSDLCYDECVSGCLIEDFQENGKITYTIEVEENREYHESIIEDHKEIYVNLVDEIYCKVMEMIED